MRSLRTAIYSVATAAMVVACEMDATDIIFDAASPSVVVSCVALPGEPLLVEAYSSVAYSDSVSRRPLSDASVHVSCGSASSAARECESPVEQGRFGVLFPDVRPSVGDSVSISVTHDGRQARSAFVMPSAPVVVALDTATARRDTGALVLRLSLRDPVETADFYEVMVIRRAWTDGHPTDSVVQGVFSGVHFASLPNSLLNTSPRLGLFSDVYFTSPTPVLVFQCSRSDFRTSPSEQVDSVSLVVRTFHHSEDYYYFRLTSSSSQNSVVLPIFSAASVHSNVSGGLGIAAGVSFTDVSPFIVRPPHHKPIMSPKH